MRWGDIEAQGANNLRDLGSDSSVKAGFFLTSSTTVNNFKITGEGFLRVGEFLSHVKTIDASANTVWVLICTICTTISILSGYLSARMMVLRETISGAIPHVPGGF